MEILKKFENVINEADMKELTASIQKLVNEQAELKTAEATKAIQTEADAKVVKLVAEGIEAGKVEIVKEYDAKMVILESNLVEKLDQFLDTQITEQISEEALEGVALNEVFKPIVLGIKNLFEENFVELDTDGHKLLGEAKTEIETLEAKVNEEIENTMTVKAENETLKTKMLVMESTKDLTVAQIERVKTFFADKPYDEVNEKVDQFVEMILNETVTTEIKDEKVVDGATVIAEGDGEGNDSTKILTEDAKMLKKADSVLS